MQRAPPPLRPAVGGVKAVGGRKAVGGVRPPPPLSDEVTLWKAEGYGKEAWRCPYGCEPVETPSCYTHHYACRFWTEHAGAVPF